MTNHMLHPEQQSSDRFRAAHFAHLRHLSIFVLVVDSGSFTRAAQRIGVGKSRISRHVSELEDFVGAKLLNRSTRSVSLTDEGRVIYHDSAAMVAHATAALEKLDGDLPLQGKLRIAATVEHGQYVLPPIIAAFLADRPGLDVELVLGDAFIDLVDHRIDLAIRVGSPGPSPQNISRKIADLQYKLYANADLLAQSRPIRTPQEAAAHPWLLNAQSTARASWTFEKDGQRTTVAVPSRVVSNAFNARVEIAKHGAHLIAIPDFVPAEFLGERLVPVLTDYQIVPGYPIYAVYPDARFLSPKVAAFLTLLKDMHP